MVHGLTCYHDDDDDGKGAERKEENKTFFCANTKGKFTLM